MKLSIIIPTKDRPEIFSRTLSGAVEATRHIQSEIIVVNDSRISRPDLGKYGNENVWLVDNPKSGVASARNTGAKAARAPLLLFLDDDILISRASIDQTLQLHFDFPNACANPDWVYPDDLQQSVSESLFGRFLVKYKLTSFKGWYNHALWKDLAVFESPMVASFHLSISKENFDKVGGYNEVFPHAGFEDYDFPLRLKKTGVSLLIDTRCRVYHNEADRQSLRGWLQRQVRGGETRKVGVQVGYNELKIPYSTSKVLVLKRLLAMKPFLVAVTESVPNVKAFDIIYFRLVLTLQAICIFEGYQKA